MESKVFECLEWSFVPAPGYELFVGLHGMDFLSEVIWCRYLQKYVAFLFLSAAELLAVVLFHLSHFLLKRNSSEKKISHTGNPIGSFSTPAKHSIN